MKSAIVIPWRDSGCIYRRRHFEFLQDYYSQILPVVIGDHDDERFNWSTARNEGVRQADADVVAVIDADTYVLHDQVLQAIELADTSRVLTKPFDVFGYLTEESTASFYRGRFNPDFQNEPTRLFIGGAYIMRKDLWFQIGGMDEAFVDYGGEDNAIHAQSERILGDSKWVAGWAYHLYHPAERTMSEANLKILREKYWR